jgi:hypothetical protein
MAVNYNNPFSNLNVKKPFQIQEKAADKQSVDFIKTHDTDGSGGLNLQELVDAGGLLGDQASMTPQAKEKLKRLYSSVAGSDELSAVELTQARLVMDNSIQGGDGQITAEEQQAFEQNLENNLQGNSKLGQTINYSNLFEFGKSTGVHDKLAPSAIEKKDAFGYANVANEDLLSTSQIMKEHDKIFTELMEALGTMNGLSNLNMGGGSMVGPDPNMQVALLYQNLQGMLERTAAIQKKGKLGGIPPISPSQNP